MVESMESADKSLCGSLEKMAKTMDTFAQSMSQLAGVLARNHQPNNQYGMYQHQSPYQMQSNDNAPNYRPNYTQLD